MNGSPLKKGLICGGICLAAVAALCLFVFLPPSGNKNRKERRADRPETVREQPGQTEQPALSGNNMAFTAAAYQVPANQDTDMNQYLDRQGLAESDVIWSSDSDQAQIGSQGHLVITDYGVSATLTAASKSDENVKTSCQVSTRTEQDDLSYQVQSLNGREEAESSPDPASGQPEVVRLNETQQNTGISFQKKSMRLPEETSRISGTGLCFIRWRISVWSQTKMVKSTITRWKGRSFRIWIPEMRWSMRFTVIRLPTR